MNATVQLADVSKAFGEIKAVQQVSFELLAGQTIALVGHNGAGKTTLMKMMLGLIRPSHGALQVLGENPAAGQFTARLRLGYLPENVSFTPALSGLEIMSYYMRLKRRPVAEALPLLERVGLAAAAKRRVNTYSKGMRQRLGLAQALIGEPRLLLLDEPTTGLDPELRRTFYEIVDRLSRAGATVLLSSHALTELEQRAARIIVMSRGHMVADGAIAELRNKARLPTRIRITMQQPDRDAAWLEGLGEPRLINGHMIEIAATPEQKVEVLRRATVPGLGVEDIEVEPPSLDDLYVHFLRLQGSPS